MISINDYKGLKVGDCFITISILGVRNGHTLQKNSICEIIDIIHVEQWANQYINPYIHFRCGDYTGYFQLGSPNSEKCNISLRETNLNTLLHD